MPHDRPHDVAVDRVVGVPETVSDIGDLAPGDMWLSRFEIVRKVPRCLADDLEATLNPELKEPVRLECREIESPSDPR